MLRFRQACSGQLPCHGQSAQGWSLLARWASGTDPRANADSLLQELDGFIAGSVNSKIMPRPDFSDYVAHFTKDAEPFSAKDHAGDASVKKINGTAFERLIAILKSQTIIATRMPWTNLHAVAFTECPWGSLLDHTKQYSAYGIGFKKAHLFAAGGGPAIYLRPDLHEKQKGFKSEQKPEWKGFDSRLYAFVTPFCPNYASAEYKEKHGAKTGTVDYSHEREWRVPHDFSFKLAQIEFVVVPNYESVAKFPKELKDMIGRNKFIMIDVYSQIEKLWPV